MEIEFETTREEDKIINGIVKRANKLKINFNDNLSLQMDLSATHSNGTPLDFNKLINFDDHNFIHDIVGIQNHIDRTNGKLTRCFLPRCSK